MKKTIVTVPVFTLNVSASNLTNDLLGNGKPTRSRTPKRVCARPGCFREVRKKSARICSYCRNGR